MSIGPWQIVIVALVVILLFGRGKISHMMGDVAKGINAFKKGLKDDDSADDKQTIEHSASETVADASKDQSKAS